MRMTNQLTVLIVCFGSSFSSLGYADFLTVRLLPADQLNAYYDEYEWDSQFRQVSRVMEISARQERRGRDLVTLLDETGRIIKENITLNDPLDSPYLTVGKKLTLIDREMIQRVIRNRKLNHRYEESGLPLYEFVRKMGYQQMDFIGVAATMGFMNDRDVIPNRIGNCFSVVDDVIYNGPDLGNYLWGVAASSLKVPYLAARIGVEWFECNRSEYQESLRWYQKIVLRCDGRGDQTAIRAGFRSGLGETIRLEGVPQQ